MYKPKVLIPPWSLREQFPNLQLGGSFNFYATECRYKVPAPKNELVPGAKIPVKVPFIGKPLDMNFKIGIQIPVPPCNPTCYAPMWGMLPSQTMHSHPTPLPPGT